MRPQGEEITFLIYTGAERSTEQYIPKGCRVSKETAFIVGAKGEPFKVLVLKDVEIKSEHEICLSDLLVVSEAENNLLGRDLIVMFGINLEVK